MGPLRPALEAWGDVARRAWRQGMEDNIPFVAGGLAFNILLALVPFVLLLVVGLSFLLGREPTEAAATVTGLVGGFLPARTPMAGELLSSLVADFLRTRPATTLYSALGFMWFSTRLFGSLRTAVSLIFDRSDRGIVAGKLFDLGATLVATLAVAAWVFLSVLLNLATARGAAWLAGAGVLLPDLGGAGLLAGRALALLLVLALFYALYHGLPRHRPTPRTALVAAGVTTLLFEAARELFRLLVALLNPTSLYTGTLAVVIAVVFWTYYAAFLFLVGGEVAQAVELRRAELAALRGFPPSPPVPPASHA
ncbi:MAG: YihY/virulence factor BrkB family protein [Gemmatimonadetes bacterium]|nr:YihY/virulence factor BrkB family protein [Gemmatimonadota bacterium]